MFKKLKKYFAFDSDTGMEELAEDTELRSQPGSPFLSNRAVATSGQSIDVDSAAKEIFAHVVEQFNRALPDFLKKSVDPEKEKQLLYDALADDMRTHLAALEQSTMERIDLSWREERDKLQADIKKISQTAKDVEAKRSELKAQQLSSDRQKRAMTERIRELEKQIMTMEAEKEQLDLENKSMINKVKVAQVYEKDCEQLRQQVAELSAELNRVKAEVADVQNAEPTANADNDVAAGRESDGHEPGLINALRAENEKLQQRIDELVKVEEEYYDLAEKMEHVEQQVAQIDKITESKDAKLTSMKEKLDEASRTISQRENTIAQITRELDRVKAERDDALARVKDMESHAAPDDEVPVRTIIDIADDDDILNDADWVVRANINRPKPQPQRPERPKTKKQPPREDGQMSLW